MRRVQLHVEREVPMNPKHLLQGRWTSSCDVDLGPIELGAEV